MALTESGKAHRLPPRLLQVTHPHGTVHIVRMPPPSVAKLARRPVVAGHAVIDPEATREEGRATRQTGRIGGMAIQEDHTLSGHLIDDGRCRSGIPVTAQMMRMRHTPTISRPTQRGSSPVLGPLLHGPGYQAADEEALSHDIDHDHRDGCDQGAGHDEGLVQEEAPLELSETGH